MLRVGLIINPLAGHRAGNRFGSGIARELRRDGFRVCARFTRAHGDATRIAREFVAEGQEAIVVAGGDGTLSETVQGLLEQGSDIPLGLIPIGTGNDFAKALGLTPLDWRSACRRFAEGSERRVDAGCCNDRYFVNGVGIGLDARVAIEANRLRWLRGNAVYGVALANTLLHHYHTPRVHIRDTDWRIDQGMTMLAFANGQVYGGTFRIAPQAKIDDGTLNLVIADALSRRRILGLLPAVLRGRHLGHPAVRTLSVTDAEVELESPLPVHADGEIIAANALSVRIRVLPGRLRFRV